MGVADGMNYDATQCRKSAAGFAHSQTSGRHHRKGGSAIMGPASRPAGSDAGYDPYFQATDVGPAKELASSPMVAERARRPFRRRMTVLGIVLAIVWIGVLLDPGIAG